MWSALVVVGEPSLGRATGSGDFDITPLFVAAGALLLLKVFLGIRVRWQLALVAVLAAPLLVSVADRISYPLTAALLLGFGWATSWLARRPGSSGRPPTIAR
jgi:hypothetical protein